MLPRRFKHVCFPARRVLCSNRRLQKRRNPDEINSPGFLFWRRPTLARPIAVLPSGLQRFTSVFGMGTGGATALLSPERRSACAARLWCVIRDSLNRYIDRRPTGPWLQRRFTILNSRPSFQRTINNQLTTINQPRWCADIYIQEAKINV